MIVEDYQQFLIIVSKPFISLLRLLLRITDEGVIDQVSDPFVTSTVAIISQSGGLTNT